MRTKASVPVSIVGFMLIVFALIGIRAWSTSGATPGTAVLPAEDAARIGVTVKPIAETGMITRSQAITSAAARWTVEPTLGEPFLQVLTDPDTARSEEPVIDRAVWVVRYAGLSVISPGDKELHYAYVVIDARTGKELYTKWSQ